SRRLDRLVRQLQLNPPIAKLLVGRMFEIRLLEQWDRPIIQAASDDARTDRERWRKIDAIPKQRLTVAGDRKKLLSVGRNLDRRYLTLMDRKAEQFSGTGGRGLQVGTAVPKLDHVVLAAG